MRKQDLQRFKGQTGHRRILLAAVKKLKEDLQNKAQKNHQNEEFQRPSTKYKTTPIHTENNQTH